MKLTIKESFEGVPSEPETIFWVHAKIYEEFIKNPMKSTILCICARASCFYFMPKYEGKPFEKLAWKIVNFELSEFLNWTKNSYACLVSIVLRGQISIGTVNAKIKLSAA